MDFRGEYTIETVVSWRDIWSAKDAGEPAPSDLPCYRISGPGEFQAVIWDGPSRSPERVLDNFLLDFFEDARKIKIDTIKVVSKFNYQIL